MKKFVVLLAAIFVSAGSAQARMSSSLSHAHFPTCSEGLVKQNCVCAAREMPSPLVLSFVGRDGIATPSTACADSK
jgi:hypothetical protein